jgi:hypothetical protein
MSCHWAQAPATSASRAFTGVFASLMVLDPTGSGQCVVLATLPSIGWGKRVIDNYLSAKYLLFASHSCIVHCRPMSDTVADR